MHRFEEAGYTVSAEIRFGDNPAETIVNFIENEAVDLVAMTNHGRSGLSRFLFGSVAEAVLHRASVPVMMLRSSEEAAAKLAA